MRLPIPPRENRDTKQTIPPRHHIINMKPFYEIADELGIELKPKHFTTLYLIEHHI